MKNQRPPSQVTASAAFTDRAGGLPGADDLRYKMDLILTEISAKPALRQALVSDPVKTLQELGFDLWSARSAADLWGLNADCKDNTCRLTSACGWTVCGKTTNSCLAEEDGLRRRADQILARASGDEGFRQSLITDPAKVLSDVGLDPWAGRHLAESWGVGPSGDCGHDTCRLTQACGWTVCGKTTNNCQAEESGIRERADKLLQRALDDEKLRKSLIENPLKVLTVEGFDPWTSRSIADQWGIGPAGDCGHDTCRLTQACGWTVCGKTTSTCLGA